MTNGLVKERMTYHYSNDIAYQAYNTADGAKVFVYVKIDNHTYRCGAELHIDHQINESELAQIAIQREKAREKIANMRRSARTVAQEVEMINSQEFQRLSKIVFPDKNLKIVMHKKGIEKNGDDNT